jgi:hypothetical protein
LLRSDRDLDCGADVKNRTKTPKWKQSKIVNVATDSIAKAAELRMTRSASLTTSRKSLWSQRIKKKVESKKRNKKNLSVH